MIFDKDLFTDRFLSLQRDAIYSSGAELLEKIMSVLRMRKETVSEIERYGNLEKNSRTYSPAKYQEYIDLLNAILPDTFCDIFSADDLGDALRYMQCLQIRIKRAHADPAKDRKKADELAPFLSPLKEMETTKKVLSGECRDHLRTYAEMIQEFRISLFAPEIKTKYPVSAKKLRMKIAEIRKTC